MAKKKTAVKKNSKKNAATKKTPRKKAAKNKVAMKKTSGSSAGPTADQQKISVNPYQ